MAQGERNFDSSFDREFCDYLEYHLCRTFNNSDKFEFGFWCDGVSNGPFYNAEVNREYLSVRNIMGTKKIVTSAYLGETGQDIYELTIRLGERALANYAQKNEIISTIPSEHSAKWIVLDVENRKMEISLK